MDERKFIASITDNSRYVSLQAQAEATVENVENFHLYQPVSEDRTTFIHFVIQRKQHWVAVQVSVSPFSLTSFPQQKFYSCSFRYTSCCTAFANDDTAKHIVGDVVQRIYDAYFRPGQWDFSSADCCISDLPPYLGTCPCPNIAERSLLHYFRSANVSMDLVDAKMASSTDIEVIGRQNGKRLRSSQRLIYTGGYSCSGVGSLSVDISPMKDGFSQRLTSEHDISPMEDRHNFQICISTGDISPMEDLSHSCEATLDSRDLSGGLLNKVDQYLEETSSHPHGLTKELSNSAPSPSQDVVEEPLILAPLLSQRQAEDLSNLAPDPQNTRSNSALSTYGLREELPKSAPEPLLGRKRPIELSADSLSEPHKRPVQPSIGFSSESPIDPNPESLSGSNRRPIKPVSYSRLWTRRRLIEPSYESREWFRRPSGLSVEFLC